MIVCDTLCITTKAAAGHILPIIIQMYTHTYVHDNSPKQRFFFEYMTLCVGTEKIHVHMQI